jgi:hypothetical protein
MSQITVPFSKLSAKQAKLWLMENDSEEKESWSNVKGKKNLVESVGDNLASFGIKNQSGSVIVSSNQKCFQDEYIRSMNNRFH